MRKRILSVLLVFALLITTCLGSLPAHAESGVSATDGNVPAKEESIRVTGVGIFDQTPNKGMHTFDDGNKLIQVTFNDMFWTAAESQLYVELNELINLKMLINGKTPSQWVGDYGSSTWGCVTAHVVKNDTLGQYLQINLSGLEGVPTESTDISITFLEGFAGTLTETSVWVYNTGENKPFVQQKCDENGFAVTGIGIFDYSTKGIHTFDNGKTMMQVTFNRSFWTNQTQSWVQYQSYGLSDYIKINGRTVTDLVNTFGDDCVFMHVQYNPEIGGQFLYLEFYPDEVDVRENVNNTISILEGFPLADGSALGCSYYYNYVADNNKPLHLNDSIISGVGVFDQIPAKGIHTYDSGRTLVTATFENMFWSQDTQDWVQYDSYGLTPYIKVNGRSISSWVSEYGDSAVYMHVRKDTILGQYLYFEFSNTVPGLVAKNMDNIITFTSDFPIHSQGTLRQDVSFTYQANENRPFVMNNADLSAYTTPYSKAAGNYLLWDFDNSAENFTTTAEAMVLVKGDSIRYSSTENSVLLSGEELNIPADQVKHIEFRLKTINSDSLIMKWDNGNGFTSDNQVSINLKADGEYHIYQINMTTVNSWGGIVKQLAFTTTNDSLVEFEQIRITGTSISVFPWLTGNYDSDVSLLLEIKNQLSTEENAFSIGFTGIVQYLTDTDSEGNYVPSGNYRDAAYFIRLAKATDMPVTIWLRADPWGEATSGVASTLYADDKNVMWTHSQSAYRGNETGYYLFSLALNDINGNKTDYWVQTEKLLGQCASYVAKVINANPEYVEGVTTTSEYRFLSKDKRYCLDYNPNTVNEFRSYVQQKYSNINDFNNAYGTGFSSWDLKYSNYDSTVDNYNGFDAPRNQSNSKFAELWTEFRANQISNALEVHVDVINNYIDSALIYTHQINVDDFETASPLSTGNVEGSNIGIDFHNWEATDAAITEIRSYIDDDITRTWGVPEYIPVGSTDYSTTYERFSTLCHAGAKLIAPFNYGSSDEYDLRNSESLEAISTFVKAFVGDINDDKMMDVRDIVRMKKYVATNSNTVEINQSNSDLTGDKAVSNEDLKRLINYFLFS